MTYFKNFGLVEYRYGEEDESTRVLTEDLSIYVNLLDQISDVIGFYEYYFILSGDRPDTLSYKLYGSTDYYWTFYLMNSSLKESGWPLSSKELIKYSTKLFKGGTFTPATKNDWQNLGDSTKSPFKYEIATLTSSGTPNPIVSVQIPSEGFNAINLSETDADVNRIAVSDVTGVSPGFNIAGLNIPVGTTITAVDEDLKILTLSQNRTNDYEIIDGVTFPVTFTCWRADAKKVYVQSYTETIRIGDYVIGTGIPSSQGTKITAVENDVITVADATSQTFTTSNTFTIYGGVEAYRNHTTGQVTVKSENRNGTEFHNIVPDIDILYSNDIGVSLSTASMVVETEAIHHYENSDKEWVDPVFGTDPYGATGTGLGDPLDVTAPVSSSVITNAEELESENDNARKIRIIKPQNISRLVTEFQRLVKG